VSGACLRGLGTETASAACAVRALTGGRALAVIVSVLLCHYAIGAFPMVLTWQPLPYCTVHLSKRMRGHYALLCVAADSGVL